MTRRDFVMTVGCGLLAAEVSNMAGQAVPRGNLRVVDKGVVYDKSTAVIAGNCRCKNGDILVSFNTNGDLSAGQRAGVVRSTDAGKTWGSPERYFDSVFTRGGIEVGCSLTCLSSGRLLLPYADGFYLHPGTNNYDRRALLFCPTSDDNGQTWQNTQAQCYAGLEAFVFGTVVQLVDNGALLMPVWGSYDKQGVWVPGLVKSSDGGKTWGEWRAIVPGGGGNETPIIQLPGGRLLALIRGYPSGNESEQPFHVAHSKDAGNTWTVPQKVNLDGTSPSLHITPKGRLLAGYRSTLKGANCHVSSSTDGGLKWTFELELELPHRGWHGGGYPAFSNLPDGRIFVTFHNGDPTYYVAYNILDEV